MIRLEITDPETNKIYVPHLAADFSFEMFRENPLFTRRGNYTYDIDISLKDPHNRAIYWHLDRLTSNSIPKNRKAKIISDGHVVCDGIEEILSVQNNIVKIQILADNSALNHLVADDNLKIRDLDFGRFYSFPPEQTERYHFSIYPDVPFTTGPLIEITNVEDTPYHFRNYYQYSIHPHGTNYDTNVRSMGIDTPFLLSYVERLPGLLGYELRTNELLEHERWRRLVIMDGYASNEFSKRLPSWTVNEFIQQVEMFFNCIFVVEGKFIDILSVETFFDRYGPIEIKDKDILDEKDRDCSNSSSELYLQRQNIKYGFPGSMHGALNNFNEDVEEMCQKTERSVSTGKMDYETPWRIYHEPDFDFEYVWLLNEDEKVVKPYMIKRLGPYINNRADEIAELKIIPAEVVAKTCELREVRGTSYRVVGDVCLLLAQVSLIEVEDTRNQSAFAKAISGGVSDNALDTMSVAFVADLSVPFEPSTNGAATEASGEVMRQCLTTRKYIAYHEREERVVVLQTEDNGIRDTVRCELSLTDDDGLYDRTREVNNIIDTTQLFTIRFKCRAILNPMRQFLIHGRLFVCEQLKYTYGNGRQDPIVEGLFYPYI